MNLFESARVQCPECFQRFTVTDFTIRNGRGVDTERVTIQFQCPVCEKVMEVFAGSASLESAKRSME